MASIDYNRLIVELSGYLVWDVYGEVNMYYFSVSNRPAASAQSTITADSHWLSTYCVLCCAQTNPSQLGQEREY